MAFFLNSFTLTQPGFSIACFLIGIHEAYVNGIMQVQNVSHQRRERFVSKLKLWIIQASIHSTLAGIGNGRSFSFFVILTMKQSKQTQNIQNSNLFTGVFFIPNLASKLARGCFKNFSNPIESSPEIRH